VSGSFGGGVLSRFKKAGINSFGGTESTLERNRRAFNCGLLIAVLKGLGGVSQEDQQLALFLLSELMSYASLWEDNEERNSWDPRVEIQKLLEISHE
jgi:hypothetical protein